MTGAEIYGKVEDIIASHWPAGGNLCLATIYQALGDSLTVPLVNWKGGYVQVQELCKWAKDNWLNGCKIYTTCGPYKVEDVVWEQGLGILLKTNPVRS